MSHSKIASKRNPNSHSFIRELSQINTQEKANANYKDKFTTYVYFQICYSTTRKLSGTTTSLEKDQNQQILQDVFDDFRNWNYHHEYPLHFSLNK